MVRTATGRLSWPSFPPRITRLLTASTVSSRSAVLLGVVVSSTILLGSTIMGGVLADKIGRRSMFLLGVLSMAVFAFPVFWLTDLGTAKWVWVAMLVFGTPFWFTWGVLPAYFYDFFPAQVRYTGISVGSQSATIIGGLVPLFATTLLPVAGTWRRSLSLSPP
jgi:MFS transporter, MHS family, shikimate and dehydroshikimate transport protein